jgi:hypothetical protein
MPHNWVPMNLLKVIKSHQKAKDGSALDAVGESTKIFVRLLPFRCGIANRMK